MSLTETGVRRLQARLRALNTEAQAFIPRDKADQMTRQWQERPRMARDDPEWDNTKALAIELALVSPSLLGVTAFDRLARAMGGRSAEDGQAVALHRASRHRLLRHTRDGTLDIASGEAVVLASDQPQGMLFARFAAMPDGRLIDCGPILPLDDDAVTLAMGFTRPGGRGLGNAVRCAEALYRDAVRRGSAGSPVFNPAGNPIDRLAQDWADLGRDPNATEQARARSLAGVEALLEALLDIPLARELGRPALATAYRWIAAVMVETLALRRANGSGPDLLDQVARALAAHHIPQEARVTFESLRASARRPTGGTGGQGRAKDTDLDKLVARIQALRAKTVEQGCTEQEALAAAEKVAELLDRYGLSVSELDLRNQACEGIGVETGRKRRGPIDDCIGTIAQFFDCRVWSETDADGMLRYVFFGMPADVQAAIYLNDLIDITFATETASFQVGPIYQGTESGHRRNATTSFQTGLALGICQKLNTLRGSRDRAAPAGQGRALVPVKNSVIDAELERLGLNLRRASSARRRVQAAAYGAGQVAGERFEYRPGIGAD